MRLLVAVALLAASVSAGPSKPEITIGLNSEVLDKGLLNALEPIIKWETSGSVPGVVDIEGGLTVKVQDDGEMPCSFWGRVKKTAFGSQLSCRVETSSSDFKQVGIDLRASKDAASVQVTGSAAMEDDGQQAVVVEVQNVKLSQSVVDPFIGGRLTVTPRYNVPKQQGDVTTSYGLAGTFVTVDANLEKQKVSVSQVLKGGAGVIKPSIDTKGKVELQYTRPFASGSLTANYKHANSLGLTYEQGSWVATVTSPPLEKLSSCTADDLKLNIRKAINFTD